MKRFCQAVILLTVASLLIGPLAGEVMAQKGQKKDTVRCVFHVYDVVTTKYVYGAIVTVTTSNGTQEAETGRPLGSVPFNLPKQDNVVSVEIKADGYEPFTGFLSMSDPDGVFWIPIEPN